MLWEALQVSTSTIRESAAFALGWLDDIAPQVIPVLLRLMHDAEVGVRESAVFSASKFSISSEEIRNALIMLLKDSSPIVRFAACYSLRGSSAWILKEYDNQLLHLPIIFDPTIVRFKDLSQEAVIAIVTALNDSDERVRSAAASSLRDIRNPSLEVISALLVALHDSSTSVRSAASGSLTSFDNLTPEVVMALLAAQKFLDDQEQLFSIVFRNPSPEIIATLLIAMHNTDVELRRGATVALGWLDNPTLEVVATLTSALHDPDEMVQRYAGFSFSMFMRSNPIPEVVTSLLVALRDSDATVRSIAASILRVRNNPSEEVVTALITALDDSEAAIRATIAASLEELDNPSEEVVKALVHVLHDVDASARGAAASSLGEMNVASELVVAALITARQDTVEEVVHRSIISLGKLGHLPVGDAQTLTSILQKSEEWSIRRDAAILLGQIGQGDESTIQTLLYGLLDKDTDVRSDCANALAQLSERFPSNTPLIAEKLFHALTHLEFDKVDEIEKRSAHDYAYDGLWLLDTNKSL